MDALAAAALTLIRLTDPEHNPVELNTADIVTMRDVAGGELHAEGARCAISTIDGKFLAVIEDCLTVVSLIKEAL
jgi:hypothetical protein